MMKIFHQEIWQRQLKDALIFWLYLPLLVLGPGLLIDKLASRRPLPTQLAGLLPLLSGALLIWLATAALARQGQGTPSPCRPAKKLVTTGCYALCRHPMWLGYDLMALGVILLLGSQGSLFVSYPLFLAGQFFTLRQEEKVLALKYKEQYTNYREHTAMLCPLPRSLRPKGKNA